MNMAVIYVLCLEGQTLAKKQSNFKVFCITQLGHIYCLATIVYLFVMIKHVLWWFNHNYVEP